MRPTTPRERRLVAIGLLVAAVALVQLAVIGPVLRGFRAGAEDRAALQLAYQHNVRTIAAIPRLRRQAERQRGDIARFVIAAPDAGVAGDLLKERLERVVDAAGGEFRTSDDADAPPGWIGARADAKLTLDQLTRVLARLQNDPPYLVVDSLDVAADDALVDGHLDPMDITLGVQIPLGPPEPR